MRGFTSLMFAIALASPISVRAQTIPNPVQVGYHGLNQPDQTYSVDCWSAPGSRGNWLAITGSVFTVQQALIYNPFPTLPAITKQSILYCFDSDGRPGIIAGAPQGLLLPTGSRVQVYQTLTITMASILNGKKYEIGASLPLEQDTRVDADGAGVIVRKGEHTIVIYPAGSRLTVGGGSAISYLRPDAKIASTPPEVNVTGCTVSYIDTSNQVSRSVHYQNTCALVRPEQLNSHSMGIK